MFKYVLKRLGLMLMTFCIIMLMCFVLIKLLPIVVTVQIGQDANIIYGQLEARGYICNVVYDSATQLWSYDTVPILKQLGFYLQRIFQGDFGIGVSMAEYRNQPVWDIFMEKMPPTVLINIYSTLIGVPIGLGLGIFAALKKNKWQDQVISVFIILLISVPSIVLGLIVQYVFCFKLRWFPLTMNSGFNYFTWPMFRSMLPAVFSLCLGSIAGYARFTRAELTEVLTSEFMLLARTKGLTRGQATLRHALRNAMVPIFPMILSEFVLVLSGSLVIERMFSIPGVGRLYLDSITYQDYDFFMLLSGFYTLVGLLAGIVTDISYGFIDPRIRMGAR
ncbi:MAG TPA: ABC transporter permease [Candidatus Gallimonas gallistercoris]|uniref:ABC transporter permease n=1 Tax=Candidatus Gallimonas gallistercoris TaxID=2838602 RepID=A0A9D2H257_9FIRM|nr:ABC transporter permease [Candidatus Gallimonas gallistercoris]